MVRFGKTTLTAVCIMALCDPSWAQLQRGGVKGVSSPLTSRTRNLSSGKESSSKKGSSKDDEPSCGPPDCKNTIPDFVKNILNLGFDEDTELLSGFGYCEGDFDANFDKLCCSASALRATLGDTWLTSITQDTTTSFIPSTTRKPDFLAAVFGITDRRRLAPAGSSTKPTVNVGETEAMLDSLFNTEGLAEAIETAMGESDTRRRLGLSDAALTEASRKLKNTDDGRNTRHLQEFDDDDGVVCLLGTVIAWFVEFYIGAELGGGMLGNEVASGIGDAVRKIGCDISGLLTSKCEDFSPVLDLGDFEGLDGVVGGYLAAEIPFLVCKLIKEAIAALALYIFSPWILPACHCDYRTEKQCNVDSCYDTVIASDATNGFTYVPKPDLIDDINVAATQYFPFQAIGFTELLRTCNAVPGDRSYFVARLPEGEIGGVLGGFLPLPEGGLNLPDEVVDGLAVIGECFDLAEPGAFTYEDALAMFNAIEAGVNAGSGLIIQGLTLVGALPNDVKDCLDEKIDNVGPIDGSGIAAGSLLLLGAVAVSQALSGDGDVSDFEIVVLVAVSFFFASGGQPEDLDTSLPGLLNEILGDDLTEALFNLELGGGLFPVRRGGEPIDKCLGYCFMHGGGDSD